MEREGKRWEREGRERERERGARLCFNRAREK